MQPSTQPGPEIGTAVMANPKVTSVMTAVKMAE
jgi:hypothetical protein